MKYSDWNIIAEVVFEELPVLVKQIEEMLK